MKRKLTGWFQSNVKPIHKGVYQRDIPGVGIRFSFWNGVFWGGFAIKHEHAVHNQNFPTGHRRGAWRGLSERPK